MVHYKLGVILTENDIMDDDIMFGLTQKCFKKDYYYIKSGVMAELKGLSNQIKEILKL